MTNNLLFVSSFIFGIILIRELIVNYCNNYNYIIISLLISMGIITSILNHKLTNNYIKYLDRFTMLILLIYTCVVHVLDAHCFFFAFCFCS